MELSDDEATYSHWKPEIDLLSLSPSQISAGKDGKPQLAKDKNYASAVLSAWKAECETRNKNDESSGISSMPPDISIGSEFLYSDNKDTLYGHLVMRSSSKVTALKQKAATIPEPLELPGIILFHTGAGPRDVFLHWKADSLVSKYNCVVLIADLLSDRSGRAWDDDRSWYNHIRDELLEINEVGGNAVRTRLQRRIKAAVDALQNIDGVRVNRMAGFGWCLGGQSVLELSRMKIDVMSSLISFHGVFDGVRKSSSNTIEKGTSSYLPKTLICHGNDDPFVNRLDLEAFQREMTEDGILW
eukprot:CAMPEP_0194365740 /NCGR_PEP_ID=MMETSP0174-20130528/13773_1 /TAXON_ID=216777 /ORGANISM="Proboscia alata, Strain PI-D3" /LENGTH=299 /DNA_ID=CAMNT_0039140573 /DNA_START=154 /DNA_END=1050 /DNA_ORIENTATION=-